ncbi:MAG: nickel pincer cofactor biosynthesis protein LarB [Phycisphaerae bacterium]|nr:nickel pincer cofactor biosynthesis protein LarB [Phycisphaerae bacterium]
MDAETLRELLARVRDGQVDPDAALERLRHLPFERTDCATVDHHRAIRCGFGEVIYCAGKTPEQVRDIFARLAENNPTVLATRADRAHYDAVAEAIDASTYHETARAITLRREPVAPVGHVAIVAAGTTDLPVAEEARVTAAIMGARVTTHYDVGVAGLHRLLAAAEALQAAHVIVAVAGMEGALAGVVGGLVGVPVIGVPTSVGYGASFGGVSALLTMLNSCASNVSVVNIDNGFGGGYIAALINRRAASAE